MSHANSLFDQKFRTSPTRNIFLAVQPLTYVEKFPSKRFPRGWRLCWVLRVARALELTLPRCLAVRGASSLASLLPAVSLVCPRAGPLASPTAPWASRFARKGRSPRTRARNRGREKRAVRVDRCGHNVARAHARTHTHTPTHAHTRRGRPAP